MTAAISLGTGLAIAAGAAAVGTVASAALAPSPSTPDYTGAATAQGNANLAATRLSTQIDRPNEITPYGSRTWYQGAQSPSAATTSWTPYAGGTDPNSPGYNGSTTSMYGAGGNYNSGNTANTASGPGARLPGGSSTGMTPTRSSANGVRGGSASPLPQFGGSAQPSSGYSGSTAYPSMYGTGGSSGSSSAGGVNGTGYSSSGYQNNSSNYSPGDDWTSVESLSPVQQKLFDTQNNISQQVGNVAQGTLGAVQQSFSSPASSIAAGLNPLTSSVSGGNIQTSLNAPTNADAYNALMARQNTQLDQQQDSLQTQLANQGIAPGSEAYNRAMMPLQQSRVDASNQATINAGTLQQQGVDIAQTEGNFANSGQAQQFSQGLQAGTFGNQARAQGLQENQTIRELPANELSALRSGAQVQAPQFQAYNASQTVTPTPVLQGAQLQGAAAQTQYQNQTAQFNNTMNGVYGLGGALIKYG